MNIPADPGPFVEISNPVVVGLGLPEALTLQAEDRVCPARGELFPRFENIPQEVVWQRMKDCVNMIGHDHPFAEFVACLIEVPHCLDH